ncbi:uncharacterized protein LOC143182045 [Calliopsis andreniformis]|uniref:uncharacterized protein LOC143182045 n=1 Tax=Calliopsis andreniformis TaxID=337506 RepID=UPI003FCDDF90
MQQASESEFFIEPRATQKRLYNPFSTYFALLSLTRLARTFLRASHKSRLSLLYLRTINEKKCQGRILITAAQPRRVHGGAGVSGVDWPVGARRRRLLNLARETAPFKCRRFRSFEARVRGPRARGLILDRISTFHPSLCRPPLPVFSKRQSPGERGPSRLVSFLSSLALYVSASLNDARPGRQEVAQRRCFSLGSRGSQRLCGSSDRRRVSLRAFIVTEPFCVPRALVYSVLFCCFFEDFSSTSCEHRLQRRGLASLSLHARVTESELLAEGLASRSYEPGPVLRRSRDFRGEISRRPSGFDRLGGDDSGTLWRLRWQSRLKKWRGW